MTRGLKPLLTGGHFFEAPRWHQARWWISDFFGGAVFSLAPSGEVTTELAVPTWP